MKRKERRKSQSGFVLVFLAMFIVVLLAFAAFAVDMGVLYGARTAAQRAADAGALAGAFTFIANSYATQPDTASFMAKKAALENSVLGNMIQPSEIPPTIDGHDNPWVEMSGNTRRVTVDIVHPENTFFAKVLNWDIANIRVTATAEASPTAEAAKCVKPWFIPNTALAPPNLDPYEACYPTANGSTVDPQNPPPVDPSNPPNVFLAPGVVNGVSQWVVTAWALSYLQDPSSPAFTIKPGNPQAAFQPGQFYGIKLDPIEPQDVSGEDGARWYRTNIAYCQDETLIKCGSMYYVKTGNMIGPTSQGVDIFVGPTPDTWGGWYNLYGTGLIPTYFPENSTQRKDMSFQVALAPVWDICQYATRPNWDNNQDGFRANGSQVQIPVIGFAVIFVEGMQGSDVQARLIDVKGCGSNPPPNPTTGPLALPLRLVRRTG